MADFEQYRTPAEVAAERAKEARIEKVLAQARIDGASLVVAIRDGAPPGVVEKWIDKFWDGLRGGLVADDRRGHCDRIFAVGLLLNPSINEDADRLARFDIGGAP